MADEKWGMVVDIDRCTGCQACVVACQSENNIPINEESHFKQRRPIEWIRVERYWEGEFPDIKARFIPVMCQHCDNAPCEPVCPVFATYHNEEGLNVHHASRLHALVGSVLPPFPDPVRYHPMPKGFDHAGHHARGTFSTKNLWVNPCPECSRRAEFSGPQAAPFPPSG